MIVPAIIEALVVMCRAIPALTNFFALLIGALEAWEQKRNEKIALERMAAKDSAVDDAIDRVRASATTQRGSTNSASRLPGGGDSGSGMGKGRVENN